MFRLVSLSLVYQRGHRAWGSFRSHPADKLQNQRSDAGPSAIGSSLESLLSEGWLINSRLGSLLNGEVSRLHLQILISGVRPPNLHFLQSQVILIQSLRTENPCGPHPYVP